MKEFAKIERAVHAIAPSVNVSIENNCVVLRGELDNWDDVVRCGRLPSAKNIWASSTISRFAAMNKR